MKTLPVLINEQKDTVTRLREIASDFIGPYINRPEIIGVLLTGSVARGDARISPYGGIYIDISIVISDEADFDLTKTFGESAEPYIPKHCIKIKKDIGIAIETIKMSDLLRIREFSESHIFAKNEAIILFDKEHVLTTWKNEAFKITGEEIKSRSLQRFFRFDYLVNDYRMEKWMYREADTQIMQNFNEATEAYLEFLFCINGEFIPRKDWLVYLSYELNEKTEKHEPIVKRLYTSDISQTGIQARRKYLLDIGKWMLEYCQNEKWI